MDNSHRICPFLSENARGEGVVELEATPRTQESPVFVNVYGTQEPEGFLYYSSIEESQKDIEVLKEYLKSKGGKFPDTFYGVPYDESVEGHLEAKRESYLAILKIVGNKWWLDGIATTIAEAYPRMKADHFIIPTRVLEVMELPYLTKKRLLKDVKLLIKYRNEQR